MADQKKTKRTEFSVVGLSYRVTLDMMQTMSEVVPLSARLCRDPDNAVDANAIQVILCDKPWEDFHLGYLSRHVAKELAPRMDRGRLKFSEAVVTSIDPNEGRGEISVKMKSLQKR